MSIKDFLRDEENLKAENDFLKMKIMLEHGGQFHHEDSAADLPAEVENEFLNHIIEFEKQFAQHKTIKVFDRIERPQHFKPVNEIPDLEIHKAYTSLLQYLSKYGIAFDVCSPNITERELYRFITEELFEHEMQDIRVPGMMSNFIYDEFHPDPVYDNTRSAEDCVRFILRKEPMELMYHCRDKSIQLNEYNSLTENECLEIVNRFKHAYEDLEIDEIKVLGCVIDDEESVVSGNYSVRAVSGIEHHQLVGDWKVGFDIDQEFGYWYINNIQIEGINF